MKTRNRTTNLRGVFDADVEVETTGFVLVIDGNGPGNTRHRVRLHMEDWAIAYLAEKLWLVVREREESIASSKRALRGGQ